MKRIFSVILMAALFLLLSAGMCAFTASAASCDVAPELSFSRNPSAKAFDDSYAYACGLTPRQNAAQGRAVNAASYQSSPITDLRLVSPPDKLGYITGESLDLAGLEIECVYADGERVYLESVDAQLVSADLSTSGRKNVSITIADKCVEFEIYVHNVEETVATIDPSLYPESAHNYGNNLEQTKTFTYPGAHYLTITFDHLTEVEDSYDFILIFDGAGNEIKRYTGTDAANEALIIPGDTFVIRLTSDSAVVKYGYAFSSIQATTRNTEKIIHSPVTDPATVTCTQDGLTEGSHCDICGDVLVAQENIAAIGHDYEIAFSWSDYHTSCIATVTCERECDLCETVNCTVSDGEPNRPEAVHTAAAELGGASFTDTLVCDNHLITFKDWSNGEISSKYYHLGDSVDPPPAPTKASDKTYSYSFAGWSPDVITVCNGAAVYYASYYYEYIDYTVTFVNDDGGLLSSATYHYGDAVSSPATIPTKEADNTCTYSFKGWDKVVSECRGDITYTALYTPIYIDYIVTFMDYNGEIISSASYHYGDVVILPSDPERAADEAYAYTFKSWGPEVARICNGSAAYYATYDSEYIDYTVIFKNDDGRTLSIAIYHYGDAVAFPATMPTKAADSTYTYSFAGWDKAVVSCAGDATYTATYVASFIDYTVEFRDYDGELISTGTYHFGEEVVAPQAPVRESDAVGSYSFNSWDKAVAICAGDATYTAIYDINYTDYTVIFKNDDGTVLSTGTYHFGDEVTAPSDPIKQDDGEYTYSFNGWDKEIIDCAGDAIYIATYTATEIEDVSMPEADTEPGDGAVDADEPSDNDINDEDDGIPVGAIVGIAAGSAAAVGAGAFSIFWFVIKKKRFSDLLKIFRRR